MIYEGRIWFSIRHDSRETVVNMIISEISLCGWDQRGDGQMKSDQK